MVSNTDFRKCPAPDRPEFAFIGRSNVGKSSLINMLAQRRDLAKTSSTPGKTQLINHFNINNQMYWVDLPGYGFAKVSKKQRTLWQQMIGDYLTQRSNLACLFVLLDSRHSPMAIDLDFIHFVADAQIPLSIILTKTDKGKQQDIQKNINRWKARLLEDWENVPPLFPSSATKGRGRDKILSFMAEWL